MKFKSTQVKGKGRGRLIGYPTINLKIPDNFNLKDGIYAVRVFAGDQEFPGALHFGPIPVFKEEKKTLEVFLIDTEEKQIPASKDFEVEILQFLRPIMNFPDEKELTLQISKDVKNSRKFFN